MTKWILFILTLLGIDQVTKYLVTQHFTFEGESIPVIQNFFHITYVRNPGIVFGIGGDSGIAFVFLVGVALIASAIFGYMLFTNDFKDKRKIIYTIALCLLISGALGNALDRIFQVDHRVVDFIDFNGIWRYIFNFADMCLTVGVTLFMFDQFILEPKRAKQNEVA